MRIYVASSWRNKFITQVIAELRRQSHFVYDFREDDGNGSAFNWSDIDPDWQKWTPGVFRDVLQTNPLAAHGHRRDNEALMDCESLLLVLPCGRSAHTEFGRAIGMQKPTAILLAQSEPELMYKDATRLCVNLGEVLAFYRELEHNRSQTFKMSARAITKQRPGE